MWKTPHPSEEGEALRQVENPRPGKDASFPSSPAPLAPQSSKWFVLYTTSRHEKRVAEHLNIRKIECYLPLYRSERKWHDGSKVTLELPLFPSYLFIHIQRRERAAVLEIPGALAVVGGTGGEPASLPEGTIDALRTGLKQRTVEPHRLVTIGQRARIRSGALEGLEGIVARNKNGYRVVLTLEPIMQSYAVEVDWDDLELLPPSRSSGAGSLGVARSRPNHR